MALLFVNFKMIPFLDFIFQNIKTISMPDVPPETAPASPKALMKFVMSFAKASIKNISRGKDMVRKKARCLLRL